MKINKKEVYKIFEENKGKIITPKEIMEKTGAHPSTTRVILHQLLREGKIARVGVGKYTIPEPEPKISMEKEASGYKITISANGKISKWEISNDGYTISQAWNSDFIDDYTIHLHKNIAAAITSMIKEKWKIGGSGLMNFLDEGILSTIH